MNDNRELKPSEILLTYMAACVHACALLVMLIARGVYRAAEAVDKLVLGTDQ